MYASLNVIALPIFYALCCLEMKLFINLLHLDYMFQKQIIPFPNKNWMQKEPGGFETCTLH